MNLSFENEQTNLTNRALENILRLFDRLGRTVDWAAARLDGLNRQSAKLTELGAATDRLTKPYREFEQALAGISGITGIAGTDLERLGKIARKSGVESGLGAQQAIGAFRALAERVQVPEIGMDGLVNLQKQTVTLAQAAGLSVAEAAGAVTDTLGRFGLQAAEAERVVNVLAAGSRGGSASVAELAQSLRTAGDVASEAGLSVEQAAAAVGVLSGDGLKGSEAGAALSAVVQGLKEATGADFTKTSLSDALAALGPRSQDAALMTRLFGEENAAAAKYLAEHAAQVDRMTQKVTATRAAQEMAAANTDTWTNRLEVGAARLNEWGMRISESHEGLFRLIQTGGQFAGLFQSLSPLIGGAVSVAGGFVGTVKNMVEGMLGVGNGGRAAAVGLWLKNVAMTVGSTIMSLWTKRTALASLVQGGLTKALRLAKVTMLTGVIPALAGVIASTWAWTAALLANPLTWIVLAIGALIAAVVVCWQQFEEFRAVIYTIWDTIKGFGQAVWDWVVAPFEAAWEFLKGIGNAVGSIFGGGSLEEAGQAFSDGISSGIDKATARIGSAAENMKGAVSFSANYDRHLVEEQAKTAEQKKAVPKSRQNLSPEGMVSLPETSGPGGGAVDLGAIRQMTASQGAPAVPSPRAAVTVDFKPTINISGDMSQKSRDELLSLLRRFAPELTRMVGEELRKQERGNYNGIPAIG